MVDRTLEEVVLDACRVVRLLDMEVADHRSPWAARLSFGRLRGGLCRIDGNEADEDLAGVDDPEARGGVFRVVFVDVLQVAEAQDLLREVLKIRTVYPELGLVVGIAPQEGQLTSRQRTRWALPWTRWRGRA